MPNYLIEDDEVDFKIYNNEMTISINLSAAKKNKVIKLLIEYMKEHSCVTSEKLLQNDECIMNSPVTLAEMIEVLRPDCK